MISNLYSIVYLSSSTKEMSDAELAALLDQCRKNNEPNGITGILVHNQSNFIQYLEGPEDRLIKLYEKISVDPRHSGVIKMEDGPIEVRAFENWSMAFRSLDKNALNGVTGETDKRKALCKVLKIEDTHAATVFLKTCLRTMMNERSL